ncbi:hypothetical protein R5R35_010506 [Gryllus longicercus]|uniref:Uncharacterized protein n=1 Tax=Gryllus longicercus TaxID=2509291 RepID=A0AAN9VEM8_9ORTH
MSERFKVTKSEEPNAFPNYGATTGLEPDDIHGKQPGDSDGKHPGSSVEGPIGRRRHALSCAPTPTPCVGCRPSAVALCSRLIPARASSSAAALPFAARHGAGRPAGRPAARARDGSSALCADSKAGLRVAWREKVGFVGVLSACEGWRVVIGRRSRYTPGPWPVIWCEGRRRQWSRGAFVPGGRRVVCRPHDCALPSSLCGMPCSLYL